MITNVNTSRKEPVPPLLKVSEVAKLLAMSRCTVHNLLQSGDLSGAIVSAKTSERKHQRITRDSLFKFYQKRFGQSLLSTLTPSVQP